mmetsp:Transcript_5985/g.17135  ORF Transcript_5985/g.17135 Transcript_5985/m.17135 type:complete len:170 (-) Transcript_5985:514-1023(-)|eukprot:CAMPEP_0206137546 /NCGR_PEP_ID=MMETSP1473-20131121/2650_1 /ASSEMBLY_ACC=CAM_ASM_001109 /TAXON_ID=1461547 /ORGANISM="Stichococcus sp, Strain RCC1054" /LENGTH=169 /DNA_ID=CAMNT_0053530685 /DNA_START=231 /DNA_END=740 /DNA_ORIENTATION=-
MVLASDINGEPLIGRSTASFTTAPRPPGINKNTNWLSSPGSWAFYSGLIVFGWLLLSLFMDGGIAWTWIHIIHSIITFYVFHWMKGSPVDSDQGKYDKLTFWEQFDDGVQNTPTRKFFMAVPVVTFLLAIHGSDYRRQPLFLNLMAMVISVVSKFPALHKVRLFGINKY